MLTGNQDVAHASTKWGNEANMSNAEPSKVRYDRRARRTGTRRAIRAIKSEHAGERTLIDYLAGRLTRWASTSAFFVVHLVWFGLWITWNSGAFGSHAFDPFPFGLLTMIVSLEAIFLAIFVLMVQGRESRIAELREEIALQVSLRTEEEVTKTLHLLAGLYTRLGMKVADDPELSDMLRPLDAAQIEQSLKQDIAEAEKTHRPV
ncbi:MAG TPA: DUF1003 domain-containing protein [Gemmatimonadaceae bacterium]|nr:DUF1003 domain-containing protein [Gemmatimonadaceae bacterium]